MRKEASLSQRDFAKLLKRDHVFVHRIENGDRKLDLLEFYWLCMALNKEPKAILNQIYDDFDRMSLRHSRSKPKA